jgi:hypothetical protein
MKEELICHNSFNMLALVSPGCGWWRQGPITSRVLLSVRRVQPQRDHLVLFMYLNTQTRHTEVLMQICWTKPHKIGTVVLSVLHMRKLRQSDGWVQVFPVCGPCLEALTVDREKQRSQYASQ